MTKQARGGGGTGYTGDSKPQEGTTMSVDKRLEEMIERNHSWALQESAEVRKELTQTRMGNERILEELAQTRVVHAKILESNAKIIEDNAKIIKDNAKIMEDYVDIRKEFAQNRVEDAKNRIENAKDREVLRSENANLRVEMIRDITDTKTSSMKATMALYRWLAIAGAIGGAVGGLLGIFLK